MEQDVTFMLKAFFFGLERMAEQLALKQIGRSTGVAEYILANLIRRCISTGTSGMSCDELCRSSYNQGYWRGAIELIGLTASYPERKTAEQKTLESTLTDQYFQLALANATNAYNHSHSADAAAFLGSIYCGDSGYWGELVPYDREKGLELLQQAFDWGFEPIASYFARVTFSVSDSSVTDKWAKKYWECRSDFITRYKLTDF